MSTNNIQINSAKYLESYKIQLLFNDGKKKTIDFSDFLKKAKNPMAHKFLNKNDFKNFKVEYGDLIWGDYEMCFPIGDLYNGYI